MKKPDRITIDPEVMNGQPCIRHLRLPAKQVLEAMIATPTWGELMAEYPGLEEEDIRQCLSWASRNLGENDPLMREINIIERARDVFEDEAKAARWLHKPKRRLSGKSPLQVLDTDAGANAITSWLEQIENGVG